MTVSETTTAEMEALAKRGSQLLLAHRDKPSHQPPSLWPQLPEPPVDESEYMALWRAGAFDDDLMGGLE